MPEPKTQAMPTEPVFYECGICGAHHPIRWDGDCREDAARFFMDDLDAYYGLHWESVEMDKVDKWRAENPLPRVFTGKPGRK